VGELALNTIIIPMPSISSTETRTYQSIFLFLTIIAPLFGMLLGTHSVSIISTNEA